ncbi:BTAD domain-containing putative transcriptional regulator [Psychromarinibacter sp. S121]|uniref:BTAD domain-containing putative transcriptional regulator n=1 Tax=Psychromarinibacter sp. S121 TaxID=3415127 RepID=UPI003C7CC34D
MQSKLELRIDGPFEARDESGAPVAGLSARGRAMLAFLALSPDTRASRETLATLLWGDRAETQARGSLRQELSALRKVLPEGVLDADRDCVRLIGAAVAPPPPGAVLLDGVAISSGAFEDWLRDARSRRADDLADRSLTAARAALAAGDGRTAQAEAARALDHAPDSEAALRCLIDAVAAGGDRATAHAAFRRYVERQHTEHGTQVPADLQALVDGVRAPAAARPEGREPAVAVLPFDELSGGAGDMFADGIVEEITGALSHVQAFRVIARQSAFALKGEALDVQETARRLRADYLVEGSVRRSGDRVRIAVQLVGGETGETLWSERYDDRMDDLFDLQDRIAAHVAGQLSPSLRRAEILRARSFRPEDRSAYDLVLTALPHFWAHQKDENARAVALLNAALERDPDYAPALAYKAWALAQQPSYMWSDDPDSDHRAALTTARAALERVGDHAPSLVAIGAAITLSSGEVRLAERIIDRALTIDPNNAWGLMRRGWLYTYIDRAADALDVFDRAEELSPLDPFRFNIFFGQAVAVRVLGRYEEAIRLIHEGMHANPGCTWVYRVLAGVYKLMGRDADSDAALEKLLEHYPHLTARYLMNCIPPSARDFQPDYVDALRRLGLPEG